MIFKVHNRQVLGKSAEHVADFSKASKVLLDDILLVERRRNVPALDGGAVSSCCTTETLQAFTALMAPRGGYGFLLRFWNVHWI